MILPRASLLLLVLILDTLSTTQFSGIKIEPYTIAIKSEVTPGNTSSYHISIYIIFGKYKFKTFYNEAGTTVPVCGTSRCVYAISICIRFTTSLNEFKFDLTTPTPPVNIDLADLDTPEKQNAFIELFPDIIKEGQIEEVRYTTVPGSLDNRTSRLENAQIYLNGILSGDTRVWITDAFLLDYDNGSLIVKNGEPVNANLNTFYELVPPISNSRIELVGKENCLFNRRLAMAAFCSELYFNSEMCTYYNKLNKIGTACGEDLKQGEERISILGNITKIIKIIWDIIKEFLNRINN